MLLRRTLCSIFGDSEHAVE